jgi:site-specific DNA recombinase
MLTRLQEGPAPDYLIVLKVNRLIRQVADFVDIERLAKAAGVRLVSALENIDETPSGRLMAYIQAAVAEYENANLSENVRLGMARKAEVGGAGVPRAVGLRVLRTAQQFSQEQWA